MIDKLMKKKKASPMSDEYKSAKSELLKNLISDMNDHISGPLKEMKMKKVTVAAQDDQGLKEGLHKAEDVINEKHDMNEEMPDSQEEEAAEGDDMEGLDECSDEELDEIMAKIKEIKDSRQGE